LEALAGHQVPHGLGVLWGIDVINSLGVLWGVTSESDRDRIHRIIASHFTYELPISPSAGELVDMVKRDKKVSHGRMYFALLKSPGDLVIEPRDLDDVLTEQVDRVLKEDLVFSRS
jgi:3-dehydroquinate synthase